MEWTKKKTDWGGERFDLIVENGRRLHVYDPKGKLKSGIRWSVYEADGSTLVGRGKNCPDVEAAKQAAIECAEAK